jgi:DNA-binding NarL/FixJ family response regulator
MTPEQIRVLVVDDQQLVRAGFRVILDAEPDISVVAEAGDGETAIAAAISFSPDVVLMDIRMPDVDGLAASRVVLAETTSRVLILTTFGTDEYVYAALRAGASGFLLKDAPSEQLVAAVRSVAGSGAPSRAGHPDTSRTRRPAPARSRALQRRDRRAARDRGEHREDSRHQDPAQARSPGSGAGRGPGLRHWLRHS